MNVDRSDLAKLKAAGVDISCRCPKPCMPHSSYYRGEALRKLPRPNAPAYSSRDITIGNQRIEIDIKVTGSLAKLMVAFILTRLDKLFDRIRVGQTTVEEAD